MLSQEVADCGTLGHSRDSAGSLVDGVRVHEIQGLVPDHWKVKPGAVSHAGPGEQRQVLGSAQGPKDSRVGILTGW